MPSDSPCRTKSFLWAITCRKEELADPGPALRPYVPCRRGVGMRSRSRNVTADFDAHVLATAVGVTPTCHKRHLPTNLADPRIAVSRKEYPGHGHARRKVPN